MEKFSPVEINLQNLKGFAVHPKTDCPHIQISHINNTHKLFDLLKRLVIPGVCKDCGSMEENWICMCCNGVFCSRYVKGHMSQHNATNKHEVAMSFTDGSFWCFECDNYITSSPLNYLSLKFSSIKFPDGDDKNQMEELTKILQNSLEISEKKQEPLFLKKEEQKNKEKEEAPKLPTGKLVESPVLKQAQDSKSQKDAKYTWQRLVSDIKDKKAKNIVFLTGAGISVSAGIPDFRSPNSGIYSRLAAYNLPQPESIFDINFFKRNPEPFYKFSKELFSSKISPTISHKFIKKIHDEGQLLKAITQNIDSLEINAGLPLDKLIQAHGHSRSAHCIKCKTEFPAKQFEKAIQEQRIMKCSCEGFIKPDITFFGEAMPLDFHHAPEIVENADLVIVMGTSLLVFPFAFLVEMVNKDVPLVLINNTNSLGSKFPNALWLQGNLDQRVSQICKALDWKW